MPSINTLYIDGDRLMLTHYCNSGKNRQPQVAAFGLNPVAHHQELYYSC